MRRKPSQPLFLERRTYRRNRLQDAARLLPVLGAGLIFAPVFILGDASEGPGMGEWLVYFFVIWLVLIALTLVLSRSLARDVADEAGTVPVSERASLDGQTPDRASAMKLAERQETSAHSRGPTGGVGRD